MFYNALTNHIYSDKNQTLLILSSQNMNIDSYKVAGFDQWLQLGRVVSKGQKANKIFLKTVKKVGDEGDTIPVFKAVNVFFECQTEEYVKREVAA